MKKLFVFLLIICICFSAFSGCRKTADVPQDDASSEENIVLPPNRVGASGKTELRLARSYTFEEAFETADIVAIIEIGNWICESEEYFATFFEASPIKVYKGDLPQDFIFTQFGYSEYTARHYPLFSYGEKLLVFLSTNTERLDGIEFDTFVYSIGDYSTVAYVAEDDSGNIYLMDWLGMIGNSVPDAKNYIANTDIYEKLKMSLSNSSDIVDQEFPREFQSIILLDDFEKAFKTTD